MREFIVVLLVVVAIMAVVTGPVKAIMDTGACFDAQYSMWQNISANLACLMSIVMNNDVIDWLNDNDVDDNDGWP